MSKIQLKGSKEMSAVKEHMMIFLAIAGFIVGVAILLVLAASCVMLGHAAVTWLWKALGN